MLVEIAPREKDACVTVTDTVRGISPQHLANIFRPFFTTKGNGTGLGLSLARRIVEEHHGRINVTSTVTSGTASITSSGAGIPGQLDLNGGQGILSAKHAHQARGWSRPRRWFEISRHWRGE